MANPPQVAMTCLTIMLSLLAIALVAYAIVTGNVGSPFSKTRRSTVQSS